MNIEKTMHIDVKIVTLKKYSQKYWRAVSSSEVWEASDTPAEWEMRWSDTGETFSLKIKRWKTKPTQHNTQWKEKVNTEFRTYERKIDIMCTSSYILDTGDFCVENKDLFHK